MESDFKTQDKKGKILKDNKNTQVKFKNKMPSKRITRNEFDF